MEDSIKNNIYRLNKEGKSLKEIEGELGVHYTTVYYWLKKSPSFQKSNRCMPKLSQKESSHIEKCKREGRCIVCGKKKVGKWRKTNYCSQQCWEIGSIRFQRPWEYKKIIENYPVGHERG